jgi:DNA-binding transcriptional regulator GbsR (MarR family)
MSDSAAEQFTEQIGVILEKEGHARCAGRLFARLLLAEHETSLDDLAQQLGMSKASVSINARLLEQHGVLEKVSHAGDRRDYYRVSEDLFGRMMEQRLAKWTRLHEAVSNARRDLPLHDADVRQRLDDFADGSERIIGIIRESLTAWRYRLGRRRRDLSATH